jgi:hypothetical protein
MIVFHRIRMDLLVLTIMELFEGINMHVCLSLTGPHTRTIQDSGPHNNDSVLMALTARRHGIDLNLSVAKLAAYVGQDLEVQQRCVVALVGCRAGLSLILEALRSMWPAHGHMR